MSIAFDTLYYLANNPDVATAVARGQFSSAYEHYVLFGAVEMRNPNALFNAKEYAEMNPDVSAAVGAGYFASAWDHYIAFGMAEGRPGSKALVSFDEAGYLALNPDVAAAVTAGGFKSGYEHYVNFGFNENRKWVDAGTPLTANTDVISSNKFAADMVYVPGGNNFVNSLQDGDKLTGIGTNPTLNATLGNANDNGGTTIKPTLNGIETINANFIGSGGGAGAVNTLNLENATGLKTINVTGIASATTVTFDNLSAAATNSFGLAGIGLAAIADFRFKDGVLNGLADAGSLTLKGAALSAVEIQSANDKEGFETLTITSQGGYNAIAQLRAAQLTNLVINGDKAVALGALSEGLENEYVPGANAIVNGTSALTTIDASALTGALSIDLSGYTNVQTLNATSGELVYLDVKGGSADDLFVINVATADSGLKIAGGAGTDTVRVTANLTDNAATPVKTAITAVEKLDVTGVVAGTVEVDTNLISDLATVILRNEVTAGGAVTFDLDALSATAAKNIHIQHAVTGSNGLTQNIVRAELADGSGNADEVAVTIDTNLNANQRFNLQLEASAAGTGVVENVTINDADNESNTVQLLSANAGTITLKGGQAGQFLNLDASANARQADLTGGVADTAGFKGGVSGVTDQLVAAKIDATAHVGDVTVRVSTNAASLTGAQSIAFGTGNDMVIFDQQGASNAGLSLADTVSGGAGSDTLALNGNVRVTLGHSEWTNVTGFETIRLLGNGNSAVGGTASNNGYGQVNAYNLTLTDQLIDNNGVALTGDVRSIAIVNDNGTAVADESGVTIDATSLSANRTFSYDGEEDAGATADRFILTDRTINGSAVIDGGDINTTGRVQNNDILEMRNSAVVSTGDLVNVKNIGFLEARSDQSTAQHYHISLNDTVLDQFDTSQSATAAARENFTVRAYENSLLPAADRLTITAAETTNAFNLTVGGARGINDLKLGAGDDKVVLWGGFTAGTYVGLDAAGRDVSIVSDFDNATLSVGTRKVADVIDFGGGSDTLITYGNIDLTEGSFLNLENPIIANSGLVVKASQLAAGGDFANGITFEGNQLHRLIIVDDIVGANTIDLSKVIVNGGRLNYNIIGDATHTVSTLPVLGAGNSAGTVANDPTLLELTQLGVEMPGRALVTTAAAFNSITGANITDAKGITNGDDTIQALSAHLAGSTISGGAGNDTLVITDLATFAKPTVDTLEVIRLDAGANGAVMPDAALTVRNNSSAAATLTLGNAANQVYEGNTGIDTITLGAAGQIVRTGAGDDVVSATFAQLATGTIDGGLGNDTLALTGGGSVNLSNSPSTVVSNIETLSVTEAATASTVTLADGIVNLSTAANSDGAVTSAINFNLTGAQATALTSTSFAVTSAAQTLNLTDGAAATFNTGLNFTNLSELNYNALGNTVTMTRQQLVDIQASLTNTGIVKGSVSTNDVLTLTTALTAGSDLDRVSLIETINLGGGDNVITTVDNLVATGASLTINATGITGNLTFDGSAETNGRFIVNGGAGNDTITSGKGADVLTGNAGKDTFLYTKVEQSTIGARDTITDLNVLEDTVRFSHTLTGGKSWDVQTAGANGYSTWDSSTNMIKVQVDAGYLEVISTVSLGASSTLAGSRAFAYDIIGTYGQSNSIRTGSGEDRIVTDVGGTSVAETVRLSYGNITVGTALTITINGRDFSSVKTSTGDNPALDTDIEVISDLAQQITDAGIDVFAIGSIESGVIKLSLVGPQDGSAMVITYAGTRNLDFSGENASVDAIGRLLPTAARDVITAGAGQDTFYYTDAAQSLYTNRDVITDFGIGGIRDKFDFAGGSGLQWSLESSAVQTAVNAVTGTNLMDALNAAALANNTDSGIVVFEFANKTYVYIETMAYDPTPDPVSGPAYGNLFSETDLVIELTGVGHNLTVADFVGVGIM